MAALSRDEQMRDMAEVTIPDAILALDASQKSTMDVRPSRAAPLIFPSR